MYVDFLTKTFCTGAHFPPSPLDSFCQRQNSLVASHSKNILKNLKEILRRVP